MRPSRGPLMVGALVALVGAALILFWAMRRGDAVSEATGPMTTTRSTMTPAGTATGSPTILPADSATGAPSGSAPLAPSATAEPPATSAPPETGSSLRIPGIDLRAGLHPEGLRDGKVNPPAGTVMWFTGNDRVAPGEVGTSVIAGHVVANGRSDVFADLAEVRVGDRIEVAGADGSSRPFAVVRAGVVDKEALTSDPAVWGPNSSVRRLAIVTCDDAYGFRSDGHRAANYVVIAEPA